MTEDHKTPPKSYLPDHIPPTGEIECPRVHKTAPKPRISAKLRKAIELRVYKGLLWVDAAQAAGLSPSGVFNQLSKPHVKEFTATLEGQRDQAIMAKEKANKLKAQQVLGDVMEGELDNRIRLKAVELVTREPRNQPQIAVNVQTNVGGGGYEYVRPGQQMVDITPDPDHASGEQGPGKPAK